MKNRCILRLLSALLCILVLLSSVSCAQNGENAETAPNGMQFATAEGADYRLCIPTHWSINTAYGVSGGYYSLGTQSTVSVERYAITPDTEAKLSLFVAEGQTSFEESEDETAEVPSAGKLRADWFYENELKPLISSLATGGVEMITVNCEPVLLDGINAQQYHARATVGETLLHFVQVVGERRGAFYVLSFTVADALYQNLKNDYSSILAAFRFSDTPFVPETAAKEIPDSDPSPEGMKLASNGDVSYAFCVPTSWTVNENEEIFSATAPDGSSVSVIPYVPGGDEVMNVAEYFELNKAAMLRVSPGGLTMISEEEIKVDNRAAMRYEYTYTVSGVTYRYVQIITVWRGMFYNLTYTALPEHFEANLSDVQRIIDVFDFL